MSSRSRSPDDSESPRKRRRTSPRDADGSDSSRRRSLTPDSSPERRRHRTSSSPEEKSEVADFNSRRKGLPLNENTAPIDDTGHRSQKPAAFQEDRKSADGIAGGNFASITVDFRTKNGNLPSTPEDLAYELDDDYEDEDDDDLEDADDEGLRTPEKIYQQYKLKAVLNGHARGVAQVKFSPNGEQIATCSADATIKIWQTSTGQLLHILEGHLAGISTIAWSPDGVVLASGSDDKTIRLWNTKTGKQYPNAFMGHHNYVTSVAFTPKGNMLISGSYDEALYMWDVRGATTVRTLPAHSDPVGGVDVVHDGTLVVSCASDGLTRIWETHTGQCLRTLVHEDNAANSYVQFSPNGKYVLTWSLDSSIRLWDYVEGQCKKTYIGHKNTKYSLGGVFGSYAESTKAMVISGSEDGKIYFWDVVTKEILQELDAHDGPVLSLDLYRYDGLLVSAGLDGTVKIWEHE